FLFLAACGGSKGGSSYSSSDDDYGGGGGGGGSGGGSGTARAAAARDELKDAQKDAVSLTEENHRLAREVFDLKNKLGLPQEDDE
ncbi:MAG: hypothetical protein FWC26_00940, partial [Fibromonadales bacterium]|nr:hypothetical protein [Fibromonadales bacterium]